MYKLLFILLVVGCVESRIPKIVWVYWDSGYHNAGLYTQMCINNIKYFTQIDGWQFRMIDQSNVEQLVPGIHQVWEKPFFHRSFETIRGKLNSHKADFFRLSLLKKYGGIWIDANIFLIQGISWLSMLKINLNVINKYGDEPLAFMFHLSQYGSDELISLEDGGIVMPSPGYETWFIAATPNSPIMNDWYNEYWLYVENGREFISKRTQQLNIVLRQMDNYPDTHVLALSEAIQVVLQLKQRQLDNQRKSQEQPRKYAVHQYGVWGMSSQQGPLKYIKQVKWNDQQCAIMIQSDYKNLINITGHARYMIKSSRRRYTIANNIMAINNPSTNFLTVIAAYFSQIFNLLFCSNIFRIEQKSLISLYLFKYSQNACDIYLNPANNDEFKCQYNWSLIITILVILAIWICFIAYVILIKSKKSKYVQFDNVSKGQVNTSQVF